MRLADRPVRSEMADRASALDEMMREDRATRSKKVAEAMLKMVKLDIATMERAYRS